MYGSGDNFDPASSHVIPAMIRRFEDAKNANAEIVECWGTGSATRDFLHVSDAVNGIIRAAELIDEPEQVLIGSGEEVSMRELAKTIARIVGYHGRILWDIEKPDGQPRRVVATEGQRERLGFTPSKRLEDGIRETVDWWRSQK
jgi:GDP-L-fucose synthase